MPTMKATGLQHILLILALLTALTSVASSQTPDRESKFRIAQAYEASGDFVHALPLYRELAMQDPGNPVFWDSLVRALLQLKRFDEVINLVNARLATRPNEVGLLVTLGTAWYRAGNEKEAEAAWDRIIAIDPENSNLYRIVAAAETESRLLDRAAGTYRRGRAAAGDSSLFTLELAALGVATMEYAAATKEYLRWFAQNPAQLSFVMNRLSAFAGKPEGRAAAIRAVQTAMADTGGAELHEILGWLYLEGRQYADAYREAIAVDSARMLHGRGIVNFADRVLHENAPNAAVQAYRDALAGPLPVELRPSTEYGLALALKATAIPVDTDEVRLRGLFPPSPPDVPQIHRALEAFRNIVTSYPTTDYAARALYQIGLLEQEQLSDLDAAQRAFEQVRTHHATPVALRFDAALRLGALAVLRADTTAARDAYLGVVAATDASNLQTDEASLRLAELEYFAGRFERAQQMLDAVSTDVRADVTNDALQLRAFLQENLATPEALAGYAHAQFLARQHRNTEAIAELRAVVLAHPAALLGDDALLSIAALQTGAGLYDSAVVTYRSLIGQFANRSILVDEAHYRMAQVYERGLHNTQAAIAAYEDLLAHYPASLLADSARRRIRLLRGDMP